MLEQVKNWMGLIEEDGPVLRANGQLQYKLDSDGVTLKYTCPEDSAADMLMIQCVNPESALLQTIHEQWGDKDGAFGICVEALPETLVFIPFGVVDTDLNCLRLKISLVQTNKSEAKVQAFDLFEVDWTMDEYAEIKRWRPFLAMCMAVIKADGLNATKIAAARTLLLDVSSAPQSERELLKEMMINEPNLPIERQVHIFFIRFPDASKQLLFEQLAALARATGPVNSKERSIFRTIASEMGIKGAKWQELSRELNLYEEDPTADAEWDDGFFRQRKKREEELKEEKLNADLQEAYQLLALPESADEADLRKAHRKLMKEFHPDKFSSKPEEEQIIAAEKSAQINQARDLILKHLKMTENQ